MVEKKHIHDTIHKNNDIPADLGCSGILGFSVTHTLLKQM